MKIVICNYRYFVSGGPERYMFSLMDLLRRKGHEIIPFSVAYANNQKSDYSAYFVTPPGSADQVYFKEMKLTPAQKVTTAINAVYSTEAKSKLETLIGDSKPDIVQTLQIHTVLSYSLFDAAYNSGVPVVARLSNYQLMCPSEHFLRNYEICEKCHESLLYGIRYRCVQHSLPASAVRVTSLYFHRLKRTFDKVNCFIVPSFFLKQKMIDYGFPEERLIRVPTFVPVSEYQPSYDFSDYIVYAGRIAIEKGVHNLIRAFSSIKSKVRLMIIGNHQSPEAEKVLNLVKDSDLSKVEFVGYQPIDMIKKIISGAMFTVCPSIWYENNPNSIYESFALGKPVIGSDLGSIREQIIDGETGLLFAPGSVDAIAERINTLIEHPEQIKRMGKTARHYVEVGHSPEVHYNQLYDVYRRVLNS